MAKRTYNIKHPHTHPPPPLLPPQNGPKMAQIGEYPVSHWEMGRSCPNVEILINNKILISPPLDDQETAKDPSKNNYPPKTNLNATLT